MLLDDFPSGIAPRSKLPSIDNENSLLQTILSIDAFIVNSEQEMSGFEIHHNEQLLEAKVPGPVGKGR